MAYVKFATLCDSPQLDETGGMCPEPGCTGVLYVYSPEAQANRLARGAAVDTRQRCSVCQYVEESQS